MTKIKTLLDIIEVEQEGIPLILKVIARKPTQHLEGGTSLAQQSNELYVCLSKLPPELKERVKTAVEMMLRA